MFYLTIVNKILHHCHSWSARQYLLLSQKASYQKVRLMSFYCTIGSVVNDALFIVFWFLYSYAIRSFLSSFTIMLTKEELVALL